MRQELEEEAGDTDSFEHCQGKEAEMVWAPKEME